MIDTVKTLLFRDDGAGVIYECRRCGTTVDAEDDPCPTCGTDDIARIATA